MRPSTCRYKVFIIDEAHMLTKEAFNALLKTLEEPPPRATFIMATTEHAQVSRDHRQPLSALHLQNAAPGRNWWRTWKRS